MDGKGLRSEVRTWVRSRVRVRFGRHEIFWTSDTGNIMTSDTDTSSDKGMFENLKHGLGQLSDTSVHPSLKFSRSAGMADEVIKKIWRLIRWKNEHPFLWRWRRQQLDEFAIKILSIDQLENIKFQNDHHKKMIPYKNCLHLNRLNYHKNFWSWINSVTKRIRTFFYSHHLTKSLYITDYNRQKLLFILNFRWEKFFQF